MIRITFASPKGGVGKSTIIYYVTKLLSDKFKTLIVDLTDSATLSRFFGIQNNTCRR
ncbi:ParA family protein [Acidianus sp.]|uniref:ParA family protein n=1 Tax=Acidianus sp. TaxID=1872104 RepID=UPI00397C5B97